MSDSIKWPVGEDGKPERAVELLHEPDRGVFFNDRLYLLSMGIPVLEEPDGEVPFTSVLFGEAIKGGRLYVPESMAEDALFLLQNPANPEFSDDTESKEE